MRKILAVALFVPSLAFAGNSNNHNSYLDGGEQTQSQFGVNVLESSNVLHNKSIVSSKAGSQSTSSAIGVGGESASKSSAKTGDSSASQSASNSIDFHEARNAANSTFAPVVISTSDCLGSVSASGGNMFGMGSFGFTRQSKPCNVREFSKMFMAIGDYEMAESVLCQDPIVRKARKDIGNPCPSEVKTAESDICDYPTEQCKEHKKFN